MEELLAKYTDKLVAAGAAPAGTPLYGGLDAELVWNRESEDQGWLTEVMNGLNINTILYAPPSEPYAGIIRFLAKRYGDTIYPGDCETRTFLHDLPVVSRLEPGPITAALRRRKGVIIPNHGIVTFGTVSPEQAFVTFSSVCFSCFVKFFHDFLVDSRAGRVTPEQQAAFDAAAGMLEPLPETPPQLMAGPMGSEEDVHKAICEVGRLTVEYGLVDSFFGNISYQREGTLYISQTGSSLDEMAGFIDPVPLDGSSCAGITASSELTAHRVVLETTPNQAVLHGHPKFSVILSMDCDHGPCAIRDADECHIKCPEARFIGDIPIVPGEVGTGPRGLCNTLPPALQGRRGAIVYGHGVFTVGESDFTPAFANLLDIERLCRDEYFKRI
ncbi:MAG: class II aldolase/adducin family protein [Planctomycetota bacterium]|jgi:ribulose-5-phosphate 4-epimerase/fuculose-1-phosphate aldolase